MLDLNLIIEFSSPASDWLDFLATQRERGMMSVAADDEAIAALYVALNETQLYLRSHARFSTRIGPEHRVYRNQERESKLSQLWINASIKLRNVDRDLADRCFMKASYWTDPDGWSEEQVQDARIGIKSVFKKARALL